MLTLGNETLTENNMQDRGRSFLLKTRSGFRMGSRKVFVFLLIIFTQERHLEKLRRPFVYRLSNLCTFPSAGAGLLGQSSCWKYSGRQSHVSRQWLLNVEVFGHCRNTSTVWTHFHHCQYRYSLYYQTCDVGYFHLCWKTEESLIFLLGWSFVPIYSLLNMSLCFL